MARSKDDWIGQRAYSLWEADGRPDGHGDAHWQQACREYALLEQSQASQDGSELVEKLRKMAERMRAADGAGVTALPQSRKSDARSRRRKVR